MSDDMLGTVKAELATANPLEGLEPYIVADWLRALVTRCDQAEVAAASWRQIADEAAEKLHALRQRHAAEVEAAFREGYLRGNDAAFVSFHCRPDSALTIDNAWLASEARRKVGT